MLAYCYVIYIVMGRYSTYTVMHMFSKYVMTKWLHRQKEVCKGDCSLFQVVLGCWILIIWPEKYVSRYAVC